MGEVPGVRLDWLLTQLAEPAAIQDALDALLAQAPEADPNARFARHLAAWDPVIAGITAARGGDDQARAAVQQHLDEGQDSADWGNWPRYCAPSCTRNRTPACPGTWTTSTPRSPTALSPP